MKYRRRFQKWYLKRANKDPRYTYALTAIMMVLWGVVTDWRLAAAVVAGTVLHEYGHLRKIKVAYGLRNPQIVTLPNLLGMVRCEGRPVVAYQALVVTVVGCRWGGYFGAALTAAAIILHQPAIGACALVILALNILSFLPNGGDGEKAVVALFDRYVRTAVLGYCTWLLALMLIGIVAHSGTVLVFTCLYAWPLMKVVRSAAYKEITGMSEIVVPGAMDTSRMWPMTAKYKRLGMVQYGLTAAVLLGGLAVLLHQQPDAVNVLWHMATDRLLWTSTTIWEAIRRG